MDLARYETQLGYPPFEMSIEETEGVSKKHGFHLGTVERLAREIVEDTYRARVLNNLPVVTIALMRGGKMMDLFYGDGWASDLDMEDY